MATAKVQQINQADDFLLLEQFTDGNGPVPIPSCDFVITYTADSQVPYVASRIDGVFRNCCKISQTALLVSFDNHRLGAGTLKRTLELALDNVLFADGKHNIFLAQNTGYCLVDGPTTAKMISFADLEKVGVSAELIAAFTKGEDGKSAYETALECGFHGTEAEWIKSLQGASGADGKSAYEVAVKNGFSGSEQEWLESLGGHIDLEKEPLIDKIIRTGSTTEGTNLLSGANFLSGYIDEKGDIITK